MIDSHFVAETPESVGVDSQKLDVLFDRVEKEVREGLLPSVQVAIARDGKLAATRTFGTATFEGKGEAVPTDDDTLYCVFSATKAVTSAAAWLLIEEGKLSVDEVVADIIPEFGENGKAGIVVEQLFTHTAGFPSAPMRPTDFIDERVRLERFASWRLNFEPGSRFIYHPSSSMYVVAAIIERRSGMAFREFVRERISKPLGLDDLWVGLPPSQHHRVAGIVHVGEALSPEDYAQMGLKAPPATEVTEGAVEGFNRAEVREAGVPGGGGIMTASDIALFYQALIHGGRARGGPPVWKPETIEMGLRVRSGELTEMLSGTLANRTLGLIVAGEEGRTFRGFGHTNSPMSFGHGGAGGQLGWADPLTGISIGYCTNGFDRNGVRQARRGIGISSRAASCALDD